ncbi:helix-turn-helix domain-containing protein [Bartonella grahamii]|uniref:helix-turn-helix domain-containing protein n=1 Tax=Bartonella grahamii TaxID=33045 RepID=UPI001ABAA359|nr:helix-turn-helix transcriptional regulator [Bartonella grahamii]
MQNKTPHLNDISVGKKIRCRRKYMGISQEKLGKKIGVSFQQIQKYENGSNRVGAGRLQEIANILDVDISFFYTDISEKRNILYPYNEGLHSKEEYSLLKGFRKLNPKKQKAVLCLFSE